MKEKQIFAQLAAKCGTANLVAGGALLLGWFVLTALSIQIPFTGKLTFTFYQVLGLLNSNNLLESMDHGSRSGAGIYGLLALIALAAPFLHLLWKDKHAVLGGLVPLLFMLTVWIMVGHGIHSAFGGSAAGPESELEKQAEQEAMGAISWGFGAYLSFLASLYFAATAVKRFLHLRAADTPLPARSSQAAA
ncbi:MAG TPA: hypothetical protein VHU83_17410 [Bryobacteraceae bacterium]|jgi:hypothetical protein|nr:hypothetical protein [Bryobacteraceae bacterium]